MVELQNEAAMQDLCFMASQDLFSLITLSEKIREVLVSSFKSSAQVFDVRVIAHHSERKNLSFVPLAHPSAAVLAGARRHGDTNQSV